MTIGRRTDPVASLANMPGRARSTAATRSTGSAARPTSRGISRATSSSSDGYSDARVVKFDKNGRFVKAVGTRGTRQPAVQHAALDRHRLPGQRLRRRSRQRPRPGARQRSELEGELPERRQPVGGVRLGRSRPEESRQAVPLRRRTPGRTARRPPARSSPARSTRWSSTARSSASSAGPARRRANSRRFTRWTAAIPNVIYTAEINDWRSQKILLKPQADEDERELGDGR